MIPVSQNNQAQTDSQGETAEELDLSQQQVHALSRNNQNISGNFFLMIGILAVMLLITCVIFFSAYLQPQTSQLITKTKDEAKLTNQNESQDDQLPVDKVDDDFKDCSQEFVTPEVQKLIKQNRQFDIHYYVKDKHLNMKPKIFNRAKKSLKIVPQEILVLNKTEEELDSIEQKMRFPPYRPAKMPDSKKYNNMLPSVISNMFFALELEKQPNNSDYLQAEFRYYDKKYDIGRYGKQLPLCIVMSGKNNGKIVHKTYESLKRQNYTNYRIIHVDDNSQDNTIEAVTKYLQANPFIKDRTTFIYSMYQRNALYIRHLGNSYCPQDNIIVDVDTDDWIIGRQVFQLINSVYQTGHYVNGKKEDIWLFYMDHVSRSWQSGLPYSLVSGQIPDNTIDRYRIDGTWRTTMERTYLSKLYSKVDGQDFIDSHNMMKGEFYAETYDLFMQTPMFELAGRKHYKIVDEYVYFYTGSADKNYDYPEYSSASGRILPIYLPLQSLDDEPKRGPVIAPQKLIDWRFTMSDVVDKRFTKAKQDMLTLYQKEKKRILQQRQKGKKL